MSLTAIQQIDELEHSLQQRKEAALEAARLNVAEAEQTGLTLMERLREQAEAEIASYMKDAEEKAAREAKTIREAAAAEGAALRKTAMQRMDKAVALVVGGIIEAK